jgi:hypothetical protein
LDIARDVSELDTVSYMEDASRLINPLYNDGRLWFAIAN